MQKEIYEWFIQHPGIKVQSYYDRFFNQLCIHMTSGRFHSKHMIEDFDLIKDINKLLLILDHMYEELIKHEEKLLSELEALGERIKEVENANTTSTR